ncbi:hypothetical protein L210DRAFT_3506936 [Boletus edulis BED1]|uniref:Uncharacterized protein n=1 Tax=Boletus edulis BED1 TaxID=1328754 RepID=A0AAD4GBG4_BOLED|nr:hypothetical protein L210DRAFT_3506936 [Boletus edulis BED1]
MEAGQEGLVIIVAGKHPGRHDSERTGNDFVALVINYYRRRLYSRGTEKLDAKLQSWKNFLGPQNNCPTRDRARATSYAECETLIKENPSLLLLKCSQDGSFSPVRRLVMSQQPSYQGLSPQKLTTVSSMSIILNPYAYINEPLSKADERTHTLPPSETTGMSSFCPPSAADLSRHSALF